MWYIIVAILVAGYFFFVNDFLVNWYLDKQEQKYTSRIKGSIYSINQIKLVKGISDIAEGTKVSIFLYNDKISISDKVDIPINRVKGATTFRVRGVTMKGKSVFNKAAFFGLMYRPLRAVTGYLSGFVSGIVAQKINLLSIEYLNKQGQQCKGLFITGNLPVKFFADAINKQVKNY